MYFLLLERKAVKPAVADVIETKSLMRQLSLGMEVAFFGLEETKHLCLICQNVRFDWRGVEVCLYFKLSKQI
jgi:hypothetical protein